MHRLRPFLVLFPALLAGVASCRTEKATQPRLPSGVYQLLTIDGSAPPKGFGSSLEFGANGSFTYKEFSQSPSTTLTFMSSGHYELAPHSTTLMLLTVTGTNGGTAVGPCATECSATLLQSGIYVQPSPLPPSTPFGAGWRYAMLLL